MRTAAMAPYRHAPLVLLGAAAAVAVAVCSRRGFPLSGALAAGRPEPGDSHDLLFVGYFTGLALLLRVWLAVVPAGPGAAPVAVIRLAAVLWALPLAAHRAGVMLLILRALALAGVTLIGVFLPRLCAAQSLGWRALPLGVLVVAIAAAPLHGTGRYGQVSPTQHDRTSRRRDRRSPPPTCRSSSPPARTRSTSRRPPTPGPVA